MLEITIVIQKKYVLGFIHAPDTTEERIRKLEDRPTEVFQRGNREQRGKGKQST